VCCASAGADRPECGICAGPAYVVTPQEGEKRTGFPQREVVGWVGLDVFFFTGSPQAVTTTTRRSIESHAVLVAEDADRRP
jgi:hypothetical protein